MVSGYGDAGETAESWEILQKTVADMPGFARHRLEHVTETGSTNDDLKADWNGHTAVHRIRVADHQTAGRGQAGRSWWDVPGASLLCSFSWSTGKRNHSRRTPPASLVAGIAVFHALIDLWASCFPRGHGHAPGQPGFWLKWPNDLWWDDAKLGGILVESSVSPVEAEQRLVVGIGINLRGKPDPLPTGEPRMTLEKAGCLTDRPRLLAGILTHWQDLQCRHGEWVGLWTAAAGPFWRRVCEITDPDGTSWQGCPVRLDSDGTLVLETSEGGTRKLDSFQRIRFISRKP